VPKDEIASRSTIPASSAKADFIRTVLLISVQFGRHRRRYCV
jgi:hypothetical protein